MPYSRGKGGFSFGGKCTGRGLGATPYSTTSLDRWTKEMCKTEEDVLSAPWSACITSMLLWHPNTTWYNVSEGGQKKKKIPTMSVLPLGILPLGGHRGCLPSLPGHSTLREPKTRKVLTNPAAQWARAETKKQSTQERYTHTGPPLPALLPRFTKQTNRITLKAYEIHPPLSCSCNTLLR